MNITVRECIINDYTSIWQINKDALDYDFPKDSTKINLEKSINSGREKIFVAEVNNIVAGYIHGEVYSILYMDKLINILGLAVLQDYQRMGIGRKLILSIESWAKSINAIGVRLNSGINRINAHGFYRAMGYDNEKYQLRFIKNLS